MPVNANVYNVSVALVPKAADEIRMTINFKGLRSKENKRFYDNS